MKKHMFVVVSMTNLGPFLSALWVWRTGCCSLRIQQDCEYVTVKDIRVQILQIRATYIILEVLFT